MGSIDILVNNSGVSTTQRLQDVAGGLRLRLRHQRQGRVLRGARGGQAHAGARAGAAPGSFTGGRIINVPSMAGLKVLPQIGVYCMSKAAVVQMTKAMALEWGRFGINVNAICPGYIDTEINHHHWQTEQGQKLVSHAAAQARGPAAGPGCADRDAGQRPEPFHQRRRHRGGRRIRGMKIALPEQRKLVHDMVLSIRWGDMDAMGHVNNTVYFRYMETVRIEWMRAVGCDPDPQGQGPVIVNAFCNFYRQLEYPGDVRVKLYVSDPGRTTFETWCTMERTDQPGVVCAEGGATTIWVDFPQQKAETLPDWMRALVTP
jgi:acyl-CoA thioester hydrolase